MYNLCRSNLSIKERVSPSVRILGLKELLLTSPIFLCPVTGLHRSNNRNWRPVTVSSGYNRYVTAAHNVVCECKPVTYSVTLQVLRLRGRSHCKRLLYPVTDAVVSRRPSAKRKGSPSMKGRWVLITCVRIRTRDPYGFRLAA